MPNWTQFASLMDFCAVYYTTQLVRCAAFSFVLIGLVMLLRKNFFSERTFFRGILWTLFLVIPFLGRLRLFYENETVFKITWRITAVTTSWLWIDRIYMVGILVAVMRIFGKRLRLRRIVAGMEKVMFESTRIYVTGMNVTPFTIGLLKPKIVLPKVMVVNCERDELRTVIRHEQTHIRLGHFFWNCLNRKKTSGISIKFSNGEIRSRLADAGIQSGFFKVTVGGRTATHYLSQGKNTAVVHSKEQYDERYNRMTSGKFFDQFQAEQKVTVGGKEYVLGEDKKLDIEYGADIFDLM